MDYYIWSTDNEYPVPAMSNGLWLFASNREGRLLCGTLERHHWTWALRWRHVEISNSARVSDHTASAQEATPKRSHVLDCRVTAS